MLTILRDLFTLMLRHSARSTRNALRSWPNLAQFLVGNLWRIMVTVLVLVAMYLTGLLRFITQRVLHTTEETARLGFLVFVVGTLVWIALRLAHRLEAMRGLQALGLRFVASPMLVLSTLVVLMIVHSIGLERVVDNTLIGTVEAVAIPVVVIGVLVAILSGLLVVLKVANDLATPAPPVAPAATPVHHGPAAPDDGT